MSLIIIIPLILIRNFHYFINYSYLGNICVLIVIVVIYEYSIEVLITKNYNLNPIYKNLFFGKLDDLPKSKILNSIFLIIIS